VVNVLGDKFEWGVNISWLDAKEKSLMSRVGVNIIRANILFIYQNILNSILHYQ